eukprot:NODE_56_length_25944_cov_0.235287.p5 type:complete len:476 gc:universal NODE_56_length_25944_cov_0.235287:6752-8179(+)
MQNEKKLPVGLNNLGNTCFMNSALQCLISSDLFIHGYLVHHFYRNENSSKTKKIKRVDLLDALAEFASTKSNSFSPSTIKSLLANRNPLFRGYGQQDTHELLIFLLDELHEESNFILKDPVPIHIDENDQNPDPRIVWQKYKQRFDSPIIDLFSGQYKGTVQCQTCNHISNTYDPFQFVSVPIPSSLNILVFHDQIYEVKIALSETVGSLKTKLLEKFNVEFVVWDLWNHRLYKERPDSDSLEQDFIAYPKVNNPIKLRFTCKNANLPYPLLLNGTDDLMVFKNKIKSLINAYTFLGDIEFSDPIKEKEDAFYIELDEHLDTPNILKKTTLDLIESIDSNFKNFQEIADKRKNTLNHSHYTLEDCLLYFLEPEEMKEQQNLYKCPICSDFRPALKYTLFNHIPSIFCFQLKRFQSTTSDSYSRLRKVEDFIDFPLEFDIKSLVVGEPVEEPVDGSDCSDPDYYKYELYAVDVFCD